MGGAGGGLASFLKPIYPSLQPMYTLAYSLFMNTYKYRCMYPSLHSMYTLAYTAYTHPSLHPMYTLAYSLYTS